MVKQMMISGFQEISWDFFSINSFGPGMLQHVPDSRLASSFPIQPKGTVMYVYNRLHLHSYIVVPMLWVILKTQNYISYMDGELHLFHLKHPQSTVVLMI